MLEDLRQLVAQRIDTSIILVPVGTTRAESKRYFGNLYDWLSVPYDGVVGYSLVDRFGIKTVPALILLNALGKVIASTDGRALQWIGLGTTSRGEWLRHTTAPLSILIYLREHGIVACHRPQRNFILRRQGCPRVALRRLPPLCPTLRRQQLQEAQQPNLQMALTEWQTCIVEPGGGEGPDLGPPGTTGAQHRPRTLRPGLPPSQTGDQFPCRWGKASILASLRRSPKVSIPRSFNPSHWLGFTHFHPPCKSGSTEYRWTVVLIGNGGSSRPQ